jgi:hypothetical protein
VKSVSSRSLCRDVQGVVSFERLVKAGKLVFHEEGREHTVVSS